LLMVRYLFEFRGTSLVRGVIASGATRQDSQSVTAYLDGLKTTVLDVDGNGEVGDQPQVDLQISNTPLPAASRIAQPSSKMLPKQSPGSRAADAAFASYPSGWLPSADGPDVQDAAASALRRRPRLLLR
jgi:hypothetical protein